MKRHRSPPGSPTGRASGCRGWAMAVLARRARSRFPPPGRSSIAGTPDDSSLRVPELQAVEHPLRLRQRRLPRVVPADDRRDDALATDLEDRVALVLGRVEVATGSRSEEHTSELQS